MNKKYNGLKKVKTIKIIGKEEFVEKYMDKKGEIFFEINDYKDILLDFMNYIEESDAYAEFK